MSRPFTEVILLDQLTVAPGTERVALIQDEDYKACINLSQDTIHKIWGGSKADFIKLFDLPSDTPLESENVGQIAFNKTTTMNFKINLQIWFSVNNGNYVPGSNLTMDITIPSYIIFKSNNEVVYVGNSTHIYNPNLFPIIPTINSFVNSNRNPSGFNGSSYGGFGSSTPYMLFRYGVDEDDIQICLLSRNSGNVIIDGKGYLIPYFSMTFTGFNKIKRLK